MKEPEESMNRAFPDHQANLVDRSEFWRATDFKAPPYENLNLPAASGGNR